MGENIELVSGTDTDLYVTLTDTQTVPAPINLTLCTSIVWEVFKGNTLVLRKNLGDDISKIDIPNGEILIKLLASDTAPEADVSSSLYNANYYGTGLPGPILGSTVRKKYYTHESRLVYSSGTQEVPRDRLEVGLS